MDILERCPFLKELAAVKGASYARHIAAAPTVPYSRAPVLPEDANDIQSVYQLFHGPQGVVPLVGRTATGCPFGHSGRGEQQQHASVAFSTAPGVQLQHGRSPQLPQQQRRHPMAGAPMASLSLSFNFAGGMGDWWRSKTQQKPRQRKRRRSQTGGQQSGTAAQQTNSGRASSAGRGAGRMRPGGFKHLSRLLAAAAANELRCPAAVVQARAAVARLKPVQQLRPQVLPVRLLAIGAFTGLANLPSGAVRAHMRKFSPEWFLAVHATIPFIAMLRKACLMPRWAIAYTITAAVIGQVMGKRLEQMRMNGQLALGSSTNTGSSSSVGVPSLTYEQQVAALRAGHSLPWAVC